MKFIIKDKADSDFPAAVKGDLHVDPGRSLEDLIGTIVDFTITYDASDLGPDIVMSHGVISEAGQASWEEYEIVEMAETAGVVPRSGRMLIKDLPEKQSRVPNDSKT